MEVDASSKRQLDNGDKDNSMMGMDDADVVGNSAEHSCNIVRVCQRIKVELGQYEQQKSTNNSLSGRPSRKRQKS